MNRRGGARRRPPLVALPTLPASQAPDTEVEANASAPDPNPDQVWRVLDHVTRMVTHAENKAALTLASAGVLAGSLYSVVHGAHGIGAPTATVTAVCGALILAASVCAGISLWSRIWPKQEPINLIYFHHVARRYQRGDQQSAARYAEALVALTRQPDRLAADIAEQVWANAHVATSKYLWVNRGLAALLAAAALLGIACALVGF
ncbi:MAG TPA: Pycsar system effector family protein [Actinocrinis sp.]|nr:Pycsar system effector family protein [Actinocrinis sp.]